MVAPPKRGKIQRYRREPSKSITQKTNQENKKENSRNVWVVHLQFRQKFSPTVPALMSATCPPFAASASCSSSRSCSRWVSILTLTILSRASSIAFFSCARWWWALLNLLCIYIYTDRQTCVYICVCVRVCHSCLIHLSIRFNSMSIGSHSCMHHFSYLRFMLASVWMWAAWTKFCRSASSTQRRRAPPGHRSAPRRRAAAAPSARPGETMRAARHQGGLKDEEFASLAKKKVRKPHSWHLTCFMTPSD